MSKDESKRMKIYNKGRRTWPLNDNGETVECAPGSFVELDTPKAKQLLSGYPKDFIPSESVKDSPSFSKLKKDNQTLNKKNKSLSDENEALKAELEALKAASTPETPETGDPMEPGKDPKAGA